MGMATSDGLAAAMTKAMEATGGSVPPFEAELITRGLDRQEAHRVWHYHFAQWRLLLTQYRITRGEQRRALDIGLRAVYVSGPGRLFWDNIRRATGSEDLEYAAFAEHVNQLIAEADQEGQQ